MGAARFEIFMAKDGKWHWRLCPTDGGDVLAHSGERFESVAACEHGISIVVQHIREAASLLDGSGGLVGAVPMLRLFRGYADDWKWALYSDGAGVFLASSAEGYDKEGECRDAFDRVVQLVKDASVEAV